MLFSSQICEEIGIKCPVNVKMFTGKSKLGFFFRPLNLEKIKVYIHQTKCDNNDLKTSSKLCALIFLRLEGVLIVTPTTRRCRSQ